ncbi:MAG: beta-ketoacyl synthase N-terminal-like domain-containing protein, partial [Thermodesulfobacteriota bacterium]
MEHHSHSREVTVPVAIIGIGCLFPKASGLKDYWRLISHGQDAITEVPETHWSAADYFDPDPKRPDSVYCTRGGYLSPVAFDPSEFGIPPSSLEATDTSQLLGLLAAKAALEDAGYGDGRDFNRDKTSVILGVTGTQELVIPLGARLGHPHWRRALKNAGISPDKTEEVIQRISEAYVPWQESSFPGLLGNVVAGRISNRLNLGGTNCAVDAACASSMSAMHLALMELQAGRSDMVVTGGVDTLNDIFMHMCFSKTPILSPTGDVRPFSARADGSLLGEGVGLLVFKRLEDAEKDGDRVYAVIKALASSSDGRSNSIYAPHAEGQMKALRRAYEAAHVDPETVDLIEAHGTGTRVGDMVEFTALRGVFEGEGDEPKNGRRKNWCAVGSVKSMIGHTKAAAGAAGLIKAVLSLHHKILPPTLKIDTPDPKLNIEESPFYLSTRTRPWITPGDHPRRSGVSSFGFGGSNFHMVLEEYRPEKEAVSWDGAVEILALSGDTRQEVAARLEKLKQEVEAGIIDEDLSFKAAETRKEFSSGAPHRLLMVLEKTLDRFDDFADLLSSALDAVKNNIKEETRILKNIFYAGPVQTGQLAFVFPGQGSQYVDMGLDLACRFPEAVHVLERADGGDKARRLSDLIYPRPIQISEEKTEQENRLRSTDAAQPAIGAINMIMAKILNRFGIQPDAVCGHSFGELCALWAAGWIDTDTLFELAFLRGRLMAEAGTAHPGAMTAVKAPLEEIDRLIRSENLDVVLANRNSPDQGVLSGSEAAIRQAEAACREKGFGVRRLPVSAAFHSRMMTEAARPFAEAVNVAAVTPTEIPVFSNAAGTPYPKDPEAAKRVIGEQILSPVDFVNEIKNMFESGVRTFVEVGPKSVLTGLVKNILKGLPFHAIPVDLSGGRRFGITDLARLLCHLAVLGHAVDLEKWEDPAPPKRKPRMRIPLTGANYRSPSKVPKSAPAVRKAKTVPSAEKEETSANSPRFKREDGSGSVNPASSVSPRGPQNHQQDFHPAKKSPAEPAAASTPRAAAVPAGEYKRNMKKRDNPTPNPNQSAFVADAFRAVQEGLKSMQALQMQTAETHKRFLESQTQAGRTLQEMIESTQRLAEASMGIRGGAPAERRESSAPAPARTEAPTHPRPPAPESRQTVSEPARTPTPPAAQTMMEPRSAQAHQVDPTPASESTPGVDSDRARIEEILLEVVSELTGYPAEMLALDMDIEADLGIDSIKRVEILSSFEEKMPELPPVSPEIMGTLKTLGQVVEYLVGEGAVSPAFETATPPS